MGKNIYTVKSGDGWGSRKEAINYSINQARKNNSEHRIQGKDGKFRDADSYGNDPHPPRG